MGSALLALAESSIQLVPDGTLLLHGLIILIMVAVLNVTLFKPINRILEERDQQTRGRLEEARLTLNEIDKKLKDYERALREARAEGYLRRQRQLSQANACAREKPNCRLLRKRSRISLRPKKGVLLNKLRMFVACCCQRPGGSR